MFHSPGILYLYRGCRVPRVPQSFSLTGVHDSRDIKHFEIIVTSRLSCFGAAEKKKRSAAKYPRLYGPKKEECQFGAYIAAAAWRRSR